MDRFSPSPLVVLGVLPLICVSPRPWPFFNLDSNHGGCSPSPPAFTKGSLRLMRYTRSLFFFRGCVSAPPGRTPLADCFFLPIPVIGVAVLFSLSLALSSSTCHRDRRHFLACRGLSRLWLPFAIEFTRSISLSELGIPALKSHLVFPPRPVMRSPDSN